VSISSLQGPEIYVGAVLSQLLDDGCKDPVILMLSGPCKKEMLTNQKGASGHYFQNATL